MIQLILELLVALVGEALIDVLAHGLKKSGPNVVRLLICALLGSVIGTASLLVFPAHFIRNQSLRRASLLVIPVIAGGTFAALGQILRRKQKGISALDAFWPAFTFALTMAIARYLGAS